MSQDLPANQHKTVQYQKTHGGNNTYLAYVVGVQGPLNLHMQIYFPPNVEKQYITADHYEYSYISEEYPDDSLIRKGRVYHCHLRGVEICATEDPSNTKEAHIFITKRINESLGWVLVSISDIDIYNRLLVNIFDIKTRLSINTQLLSEKNYRTDEYIAKEYIRPVKNKMSFNPAVKEYYHFVYVNK